MMKNAILLHGMPNAKEYYNPAVPSASNAHWFAWLQKQLLVHDVKADTPEVPRPFDLNWQNWVKEVERFEIGPETILVGHSCGGGFWIRYLSEHPELKVGKVVLVAPWLDIGKEYASEDYFNFELDNKLIERTEGLTVFNSDDDEVSTQLTVKRIREELTGLKYKEFHGYGHFTVGGMKTTEFPELLQECLERNT